MKTSGKIVISIIAVLLVAATIAVAVTCGSETTASVFAKLIDPEADGSATKVRTEFGRPIFDSEEDEPLADIVMPAEDDLQGQKELAYHLYSIANANYQKLGNVAIFYDCLTTTGLLGQNMNANDYRYSVKDGDKYFYAEYSFAADKVGEGMLSAFSPESTLFAYMYYTDATMEDCYGEKIVNPMPTMISKDELTAKAAAGEDITIPVEGHQFNVDWQSDDLRILSVKKPTYYSAQNEKYEGTDQVITPETMKSAKVTYNEKEGFYTLELELDVDNPATTAKTLSILREGFGNDTAHYTSMIETIEIWDNGYFKNFLSVDSWTGTKIINLDFVLSFDMHYCYYGEPLNMHNYQYAERLIERAKNR